MEIKADKLYRTRFICHSVSRTPSEGEVKNLFLKNMKKILLIMVLIFFSYVSYGQEDQNSSLRIIDEEIDSTLPIESEPPLEFGIDVGYDLGRDLNTFAMMVTNIKLIRDKLFLKIEYGKTFDRKFSAGNYSSLGLDYRILNSGKSKLDYNLGIGAGWEGLFNSATNVGGVTVGAKYLYNFTDKFGVTGSLKFFSVTSKASLPFFAIGIQVK